MRQQSGHSGAVVVANRSPAQTSTLRRDEDPCSPVNCRLALDRNSPVPLWAQIETYLGEAITSERLRPGQTLSPEPELAARFLVGRPTLHHALAALDRRGLIVRRPAVGTQVAGTAARHAW